LTLGAAQGIIKSKETENGPEKKVTKSMEYSQEYSESLINTVREPLIALDQDLRVVTASRSFYEVFKAKPEETYILCLRKFLKILNSIFSICQMAKHGV